MPEAHAMLTVYAGTSLGTPLRIEICRAGLGPPPAWRALPNIVSCTYNGATLARCMAAHAATVPISAAVREASDPPNLPMGVRTAEVMKTSGKWPPVLSLAKRGDRRMGPADQRLQSGAKAR